MNPGMVLEAPIEGENMNTSNSFPYRELVGCLMYVAVTTRPDIMFSVSRLARYSTIASEMHWKAAKDVLRYLKRTSKFGLVYGGPSEMTVVGYTDADWAGDRASRKSTSGYVFLVNKTVFSWKSSLQKVVAASSTEAEYISQALCTREALWVMKLKKDFEMDDGAVVLYGDNTGAMTLAREHKTTARSKHIDVTYHFTRDYVNRGAVVFKYIPTDKMIADCMTKPLSKIKLLRFVGLMGLHE